MLSSLLLREEESHSAFGTWASRVRIGPLALRGLESCCPYSRSVFSPTPTSLQRIAGNQKQFPNSSSQVF